MTIKEAASLYGVSKQAIYQRLKKTGKPLDSIRNPETGVLTEEGECLLNSIYNQPAEKTPLQSTNLSLQVESLKKEVESLTGQVNALTQLNNQLISERDYLRRSLDQAQQLQAMAFARLPAPKETGESWIKKLFTKQTKA